MQKSGLKLGWSVCRKVILSEIAFPEGLLHVIYPSSSCLRGKKLGGIFKPNDHHRYPRTSFFLSHDQTYHSVKDVRKLFRARDFGAVFVVSAVIMSLTVSVASSACHTTLQLARMQE